MRIIRDIFCIFCFVFWVVFYLLVLLADWVVGIYKKVSKSVSKFGRRFCWAFMHAVRRFDRLGR